MDQSDVAIIVVNYGSTALIRRNLAALAGEERFLVVIVDNYSGPQERREVERLCREHGWTSVLLDTNTGFGGGVNAGLARAAELGVDCYILLNPDAVIDPATADQLADHVRRHPLDLVAPRIVRPDGTTWAVGSAVDLRSGRMRSRPGLRDLAPYELGWLSGACLALGPQLLDRVTGMPDDYFLYWEDVDFSVRTTRAGGELVVREELIVVHDEGGTQRAGAGRRLSERYFYYNCRNRLLFAARHLDRRTIAAWLVRTPRESWRILLRGGRRRLLQSPGVTLAGLAGSLAGASLALPHLAAPSRHDADHGTSRQVEGSPMTADDVAPVTALMSFPATPPKANPYRLLLERGLRKAPGLSIRYFSWRTALLGHYDVFHVHWPEILLEGSTPLRRGIRQVLFALFLLRLRLQRIPIVRTMHNLQLPKDIGRTEIALLRAAERQTALWIRLNTSTELPTDRPGVTVLHGHYRDWYGRHERSEVVPGRFLFHGLVRRYKGVPALVQAFRATTEPALSLSVVGRPSSPQLATEIVDVAAADERVDLRLQFVEDAELVAALTAAELVVLPYEEMHNSAAVLTALSLDRPVLVPDNEVNRKLVAEVGPGWIHTYKGPISATVLESALQELRTAPPVAPPDLSGRDWDLGGLQHADAYRQAVRWLRSGSRSRRQR